MEPMDDILKKKTQKDLPGTLAIEIVTLDFSSVILSLPPKKHKVFANWIGNEILVCSGIMILMIHDGNRF